EFPEACGMSLAHRIIPCLDTDGERVVKGVNFVGLRDAGDSVALAARYNAEGADELVVLDIAASRDRRPTFLETIRRVAAELAIPLTAGAGEILLTSVDRDGTQSGFDVALTAAISGAVTVPVIASGGAKSPAHFVEIFREGAADAALAASIFHDEVQSIHALKQFLASSGVEFRLSCRCPPSTC